MQLAHVSMYVSRIRQFSVPCLFLFFIFIDVNSEKICSYNKLNGMQELFYYILPISLDFLQVICQNSCSDLSSKIIFNSLSTDNLVISSFSFVESQELESTWPVKWFVIQSWKPFTFSVPGKYTKKALPSLIKWLLVFHTAAPCLTQYPQKRLRKSKYCYFQYTFGNTDF